MIQYANNRNRSTLATTRSPLENAETGVSILLRFLIFCLRSRLVLVRSDNEVAAVKARVVLF